MDKAWLDWLAARPKCVQQLAAEFPLGTAFELDGRTHYTLGYTEDDDLLVSPVDPHLYYDLALATKLIVCASHFRKGKAT